MRYPLEERDPERGWSSPVLAGRAVRASRFQIRFILALAALGVAGCFSRPAELDEIQKMAYAVKPAVVRVNAYATATLTVEPSKRSGLVTIAPDGASASTGAGGSGSGFIVNPDGWIVTSAHVIQQTMDEETIRTALLRNGAIAIIQQALDEDIVAALQRSGDVENAIKDLIGRAKLSNVEVVNRIDLSNGDSLSFEVDRLTPPTAQGGQDLALLRIGARNLPTVPLAGEPTRIQERIWIAGYPSVASSRDATLGGWLSSETDLEPTITSGSITAIRKNVNAMTIYQTDAPIYPGHSGGPAVDRNGLVIGIPSWGHVEADRIRFLIPATIARTFVAAAGVPLGAGGAFNDVYRDALEAAGRGDWTLAEKRLREADAIFPGSPDLRQFLNEAERAGSAPAALWTDRIAVVSILLALGILAIAGIRLGRNTRPSFDLPPIREEVMVSPARGDRNGEEAVSFRENGSRVLGTFTVLNGNEAGRRLGLGGSGIRIGRESRYCEIVLSDPKISRLHAEVVSLDGRTMLIDRNSSNGTFVNDERIERTFLRDGDIIYFGGRHAVAVAFTV